MTIKEDEEVLRRVRLQGDSATELDKWRVREIESRRQREDAVAREDDAAAAKRWHAYIERRDHEPRL